MDETGRVYRSVQINRRDPVRRPVGNGPVAKVFDFIVDVDLGEGDQIEMARIPDGVTILDMTLAVDRPITAAKAAFWVGDDEAPSRYMAPRLEASNGEQEGVFRVTGSTSLCTYPVPASIFFSQFTGALPFGTHMRLAILYTGSED